MKHPHNLLTLFALLITTTQTQAQDVTVPADFATITDAIRLGVDANMDGLLHIRIDPGTYNESLVVDRNDVRLEGSGAATTLIQGEAGLRVVLVRGVTNFELSGVTLSGDPTRDGIEAIGCTVLSIHDNVVTGAEDGIRVNRCIDVMILDNLVDANTSTGIKVKGGMTTVVTGNICTGNASTGIDADRTLDCVITGNMSLMNGGTGLRVRRSTQVLVESNQCVGNLSNGMRYREMSQLTVRSNTCTGNTGNGMRMRDVSGSLFTGNVLTGNAGWGVRRRDGFGNDWDEAQPGIQTAPGSNDVTGNTLGEIRTD